MGNSWDKTEEFPAYHVWWPHMTTDRSSVAYFSQQLCCLLRCFFNKWMGFLYVPIGWCHWKWRPGTWESTSGSRWTRWKLRATQKWRFAKRGSSWIRNNWSYVWKCKMPLLRFWRNFHRETSLDLTGVQTFPKTVVIAEGSSMVIRSSYQVEWNIKHTWNHQTSLFYCQNGFTFTLAQPLICQWQLDPCFHT